MNPTRTYHNDPDREHRNPEVEHHAPDADGNTWRWRVTQRRVEALAAALREVADEHHAFEQTLTEPDADWPSWYAARLVERGWR